MPLTNNNSGAHIGDVKPRGAAAIPSGWLECGGQEISRATYAALFNEIGTLYGAGDGATTFNVPDYRGRALVGRDDLGGTPANRLTTEGAGVDGVTLGAVGGGQTVTSTLTDTAAHNHGAYLNNGSTSLESSGASVANTGTQVAGISKGGGGAHRNVQPSAIVNYIIKY